MSESTQHSRIAQYIREIIEVCKNDPSRLEVAIVNFQSLVNAMKAYERAPRYFNDILEEADSFIPAGQMPHIISQEKRHDGDPYKYPIVGELEKIYKRKLKQTELQALASQLSAKTGLRLERDTKRSKALLLQWFSNNWTTLQPKIFEFHLNQMQFTK